MLSTSVLYNEKEKKPKIQRKKGIFENSESYGNSFQFNANYPIEDRFVMDERGSRIYTGVFDGHGSWQV